MKTMEQQTPYIVAFGRSLNEVTDIKLVVESINIIPISSVSLALHCCFASYYTYNISYPTDNNVVFFVHGTICLSAKAFQEATIVCIITC